MACCVLLACIIGLILAIKARIFTNKKQTLATEWRLHASQHSQKQD